MRVSYMPDPPAADTPAEDLAVVERIRARRAPRPLQALDRALLHNAAVADGWNGFLGAVRTRTSLSAAVRELAICRVAVCNRAWYEWAHHAPLAAAGGVPAAALEEIVRGVPESDALAAVDPARRRRLGLDDALWAVLRLTDEMTRNVAVADATFADVRAHFSEKEVVEIVATVSAYNCVSRFLVALDVGERNGTDPDAVAITH